MEIPAIHGWNMPLAVENRDEMYGGCDGSSFYPWMAGISMDGRIPPTACIDRHELNRYNLGVCKSLARECLNDFD